MRPIRRFFKSEIPGIREPDSGVCTVHRLYRYPGPMRVVLKSGHPGIPVRCSDFRAPGSGGRTSADTERHPEPSSESGDSRPVPRYPTPTPRGYDAIPYPGIESAPTPRVPGRYEIWTSRGLPSTTCRPPHTRPGRHGSGVSRLGVRSRDAICRPRWQGFRVPVPMREGPGPVPGSETLIPVPDPGPLSPVSRTFGYQSSRPQSRRPPNRDSGKPDSVTDLPERRLPTPVYRPGAPRVKQTSDTLLQTLTVFSIEPGNPRADDPVVPVRQSITVAVQKRIRRKDVRVMLAGGRIK